MALKTVSKLSLGQFSGKRRLEACEMAKKKNLAQPTKQRSASLLGKEVKKNLTAERGWDDYLFFT